MKKRYICQQCGTTYGRWQGKCDNCGAWNAICEDSHFNNAPANVQKAVAKTGDRLSNLEFHNLSDSAQLPTRVSTQITELDRVLGGGLVPESIVLIGGDPGIGKSTILLQTVVRIANANKKCIYITGEESVAQVQRRAKRLELSADKVLVASSGKLSTIINTLRQQEVDVVVIDSIQTMYSDSVDSAAGTISQVRFCSAELSRLAKEQGFTLILVGHVTKEGALAGPRVLEHMVDVVLYFEGDRGHAFRILRSIKNRFGATDEIGVFSMSGNGLQEVTNPSELFLSRRDLHVSGSAVFAGIEGTRPLLIEVQALVSPSNFGNARRTVVGWDNNRLAMIVAVLEARCGVPFSEKDIYLNVTGGMKLTEPAADLAVAAALVSALTDTDLPRDLVLFGEIGLSGEVRSVSFIEKRLKEASKLGFTQAILCNNGENKIKIDNMRLTTLDILRDIRPLVGL
jgi:DNA repair protein RadA/Sms